MIELRNAAFRFRNRTVVDATDLEIEPRSFTAVLGPAGSGKSALLDLIAGRLSPTSGSVAIDGVAPDCVSPARAERMRAVLGEPAPVERRSFDRALDLIGARGLASRCRPSLSTGEAACFDIAHVIAQDARYAVLDEPTKNLEIARQYEVLAVFARLASVGAGIVATLRSVDLAALFADRVLLMHDGQIVADGLPSVVLQPAFLQSVFAPRCAQSRMRAR